MSDLLARSLARANVSLELVDVRDNATAAVAEQVFRKVARTCVYVAIYFVLPAEKKFKGLYSKVSSI